MKSRSSVGKRIIWAVSMVVLCTFSTFFMSIFIGSAFPEMSIIYKGGIPVLMFIILGIISFAVQEYLLPFIKYLSVPEGLKKAIPFLLLAAGVLMMQFYYDENAGSELLKEVYSDFAVTGTLYDTSEFGFQFIYQKGLNFLCILFGHTLFAVSFYNRIYVVLSAVCVYFALKNFTRRTISSVLFLAFFLFGQKVLKVSVYPDAGLVYILICSVFLYLLSLNFYYRTRKKGLVPLFITKVLTMFAFAFLVYLEANSVIFIIAIIAVFFAGYGKLEDNVYFLTSILGSFVVVLGLIIAAVMNPVTLLKFSFILPDFQAVDYQVTTLLVLALVGFMGVYAMWNHSIRYIVPAFVGVYLIFANPDFTSQITSDLILLLAFSLYAALGIGTLNEFSEKYKDEDEDDKKTVEEEGLKDEVNIEIKADAKPETKVEVVVTPVIDKAVADEISSIKAMNEKLNQTQAGFVPMTFKKPKRQEKKAIDYGYEPSPEEMKYDIEVDENDDFDI